MNRIVAVLLACVAACFWSGAQALHVRLAPPSTTVLPGSVVGVDVLVSDIGPPGAPPSIGSFDLSVAFNPSLLSLSGVSFGPYLGDPSLFEALTDFLPLGPGSVSLAEVSLLSPGELDALQPAVFSLATLSFIGIASGTASFSFVGVPLIDDAFGVKLAIPEPATIALVGFGLIGVAGAAARRRRCPMRSHMG